MKNEFCLVFWGTEGKNGDQYNSKLIQQLFVSLQMLLKEQLPTENMKVFKHDEFFPIVKNNKKNEKTEINASWCNCAKKE